MLFWPLHCLSRNSSSNKARVPPRRMRGRWQLRFNKRSMSFARQAVVAVCVLTTCPCFSKELIYLTSGFQLEAKSHATQDQTLVLNMADGTMELPASAVAQIESVPDDPETAQQSVAPRSKQTLEERLTNAATAQGLPPEFVRCVAL